MLTSPSLNVRPPSRGSKGVSSATLLPPMRKRRAEPANADSSLRVLGVEVLQQSRRDLHWRLAKIGILRPVAQNIQPCRMNVVARDSVDSKHAGAHVVPWSEPVRLPASGGATVHSSARRGLISKSLPFVFEKPLSETCRCSALWFGRSCLHRVPQGRVGDETP